MASNYIMVKGRFKADNIFGQLIITFNQSKRVESFNIISSTYSDTYNLEPHENWTDIEEYIVDLKWKGKFNVSLTSSLTSQFKALTEDFDALDNLYDTVSNFDYDNMEVILFDNINRVIHEKNLILETAIQEISDEEYQHIISERSKPKEEESAEVTKKDSNDAVILAIKPVLAPVKGTPIYDLKIGDRISIKIQPISDKANYFIDMLDLRKDNQINATGAKVIDIKAPVSKNDQIEILTEIGPGLFGKILEDETQVKLKMHIEIEKPVKKKVEPGKNSTNNSSFNSTEQESVGFSKSTILMAAFLFLILLIFIVLIVLIW